MNTAKKILCSVIVLLLASPAYALTTGFGDRASWDSVMGTQVKLEFAGFSSGGTSPQYHQYRLPYSYNGLVFSDNNAPYSTGRLFGMNTTVGYDAPYHTTEYLAWDGARNGNMLIVTSQNSISGIAFDFGGLYGKVVPFAIGLGNGDLFVVNSAANAYSFFGATTDTPFTSFSISSGSSISDWPTIDNMSYGVVASATSGNTSGTNGTSTVPEPSTLLLLGSGMAGLVMTRLRK